MSLSFAETHFVLSFMNQVPHERADALESRLKQWQKMGFPDGVNVGRGVKASYGATQLHQLLFMMKLLHVGLTPERAQRVVKFAWTAIKDSIVETVIDISNGEDRLHYCLIQLDALSELKDPSADHMHVFVDTFNTDEISESFLTDEEFKSWLEDNDQSVTDETLRQHQYISFLTKNRMATCICIEVDSLLFLLWISLNAMKRTPAIFAEEMAEWERERRARGRVAQETEAHYERSIPHSSFIHAHQNFDHVQAARDALSQLDESSFEREPSQD